MKSVLASLIKEVSSKGLTYLKDEIDGLRQELEQLKGKKLGYSQKVIIYLVQNWVSDTIAELNDALHQGVVPKEHRKDFQEIIKGLDELLDYILDHFGSQVSEVAGWSVGLPM